MDPQEDLFPAVYARRLAADLGVGVELINHGTSDTRLVRTWTRLLTQSSPLTADLARADVVVGVLGTHDFKDILLSGTPWSSLMRERLVAIAARWPATGDAFFAALRQAVPPHATILIADGWMPPVMLDQFAAHPDWSEIRRLTILDLHDAAVPAAARHGVVMVPTFEAMNGPDGDELLTPGSWWPDVLHFDEVVHRFIAEVFRAHDGYGRSD